MPTNILRRASDTRQGSRANVAAPARGARPDKARQAILKVGRVSIRIELSATPTADLVWDALPLHSTAETWGSSIHFKVPLETGRDRSARINGAAGDIYFWVEDDRVLVPFGATPISKPGESRLPSPCNAWAKAIDDVTVFAKVTPGEKVSLTAV